MESVVQILSIWRGTVYQVRYTIPVVLLLVVLLLNVLFVVHTAAYVTLSYADPLAQTDSESVEAIVRKRRTLFAGFVARIGEERQPQRVMFGGACWG